MVRWSLLLPKRWYRTQVQLRGLVVILTFSLLPGGKKSVFHHGQAGVATHFLVLFLWFLISSPLSLVLNATAEQDLILTKTMCASRAAAKPLELVNDELTVKG